MALSTETSIPEEFKSKLADALQGQLSTVPVLKGMGAVQARYDLVLGQGMTIQIPNWNSIGKFNKIVNDGDDLVASKLALDAFTVPIEHFASGVTITRSMEALLPSVDEAKRQILEGYEVAVESVLMNVAKAKDTSMTVDGWTGTPVSLSWDMIVDGLTLFGARQNDVAGIIVNPKVLASLRKMKDGSNRPLFESASEGGFGKIMNINVYMSDLLADEAGKYTTLIIKKNSLGLRAKEQPILAIEENSKNDTTSLNCHMYVAGIKYPGTKDNTTSGVAIIHHKL